MNFLASSILVVTVMIAAEDGTPSMSCAGTAGVTASPGNPHLASR